MSPKIWANKKLIADVPDETGWHQTLEGSPLYVNVDLIDANKQQQRLILEANRIGGLRVIGLTLEGKGNSMNHRRGDGKTPPISVELNEKPIRVTHGTTLGWEGSDDIYMTGRGDYGPIPGPRQTDMNPRWVRNPERR